MKTKLALASILLAACGTASADAGILLGVAYTFGGTWGVTAKVLSSDQRDKAVIAAGATWYPMAAGQKFGVDLGAGYNFSNSAAIVSYDFMQRKVQGSLGFVDTRD